MDCTLPTEAFVVMRMPSSTHIRTNASLDVSEVAPFMRSASMALACARRRFIVMYRFGMLCSWCRSRGPQVGRGWRRRSSQGDGSWG